MKKEYKKILKNASVLIVEDNTNFRQKFKITLQNYFDTIYEASNGDEGIDIYQTCKPSVIFTDIKMPKMTGVTFASFIRKLDKTVPIVALSAYSERETLIELISLHLIDFLEKPIEFEALKNVLDKTARHLIENGLLEYTILPDLKYSFSRKVLFFREKEIALTHKEVLFLELIIENRHRVVTKEMIEEVIYSAKSTSDSAINNLLFKLRKKIGENIFKTIPGIGFSLVK